MAVDGDGEADAGVLEEGVFLFAELDGELAVLAAGLVVVAVSPEDADAAEVLAEVGGRTHVRTGEETEAAGVDFETLVDGEFAGEINGAFGVFGGDFVVVGEWIREKRGGHGG